MKTDNKKIYKTTITVLITALVAILFFAFVRPISRIGNWLSSSSEPPVKYIEADRYPVNILNITLDKKPTSIICLDINAIEELKALGYIDLLTGVCDGYTDDTHSEENQFGSVQNPDFEKILLVKPDLLITSFPIPSGRMSEFSEAGIKVLVLPEFKLEEQNGKNNYTDILSLVGGYENSSEVQ